MLRDKIAAAIQVTIDDVDEEFASTSPLFKLGEIRDLDFIETAAAASILQGFYTGIENLLLYLCKTLDGSIPQNPSWHQVLLELVCKPTTQR